MRNIELVDQSAEALLSDWQAGNEAARDQLFELLHIELKRISKNLLRGEGDISLMTGDLINESVLRLIKSEKIELHNKAHFLSLAARTMRRILIDHVRSHKTNKRHHQKVTLATQVQVSPESIDLDHLENAMVRLRVLDENRANIIEMRYYGGMSTEDIAIVVGCSASTIKRTWRSARAWLLETIEEQKAL